MTDPIALVTGGSRGFGRALAISLASDGWRVVTDARSTRDLRTIEESPGIIAIAGDVTDRTHQTALLEAVTALGGLDLLVNNASTLGASPLPRLERIGLDVLQNIFAVNVVAPVALMQLALPLLRQRRGSIVNLTSDAAVEPYETWSGYGSSKAALEQAGNVLGAEEGGVRVYAFDPGDMRTQMHQDAFPGEDISDRPEPDAVVPALRRLLELAPPSGRYRAADVTAVVA
jgi:NAD(P)-dependent dehydrogenase (short-subunit alcohol dehydrogenase family)